MKFFRWFLSSSGLLTAVLLYGCESRVLEASEFSLASTHLAVPAPPRVLTNQKLWVALEAYLGHIKPNETLPANLVLESADEKLLLQDSQGIKHKSSRIILSWKKVPLKKSRLIQRKVAGPFASFESADRFANQLRSRGIHAQIARPDDWEVWLKKDQKIQKEAQFFFWSKTFKFHVQPVLKTRNSSILLSGPVNIIAPGGLRWKGGVYNGPFVLQPDAYGTWTFLEKIPLEDYLQGVVPYEIGNSSPPNALAVQAVLARTWAIANSHRFLIDGYHLCSDTQCQVYKNPTKASTEVKRAIAKTAGKVLTWKRRPINAVYHASNGGVMAAGDEAWSMKSVPYLRTKLDGTLKWQNLFHLPLSNRTNVKSLLEQQEGAYGSFHPRFRWTRVISKEELKAVLNVSKINAISPIGLSVLERGASGRVLSLKINDSEKSQQVILKLDQIRRTLRMLPSTLFVVEEIEDEKWKFYGGGFGHGAGLSQAGAIDLAERGWTIKEILQHYYPGAIYRTLSEVFKAP